jgi:hypothetical protein
LEEVAGAVVALVLAAEVVATPVAMVLQRLLPLRCRQQWNRWRT